MQGFCSNMDRCEKLHMDFPDTCMARPFFRLPDTKFTKLNKDYPV